jgi:hypothetical protein
VREPLLLHHSRRCLQISSAFAAKTKGAVAPLVINKLRELQYQLQRQIDVIHMEGVLQTKLAKGLKLRISKCKFDKTSIVTLGFLVSYHSMNPSDNHVQKLVAFPNLRCDPSLPRFFGVFSFFGGGSNDVRIGRRRCTRFCATRHVIGRRPNVRNMYFEARSTQENAFDDVRSAMANR